MTQFRFFALESLIIFCGSFVGPLLLYKYATELTYPVLSAYLMFYGFALGGANGIVFNANGLVGVAIAALVGVSLLWLPIVLVTYGFALMAMPIFFTYAGCVVAGRFITNKLRHSQVC